MPWLIDGSNLLGAMRVDRIAEESKRGLVRLLAAFARAKKTRVTLVFDGPEPPSFGRVLGGLTVVFSAGRPADDVIVERAAQGRGWSVVTNDRQLTDRVARSQVEIVAATPFIRQMEEAAASAEERPEEDWGAYFSDPKNRLDF
jgi:predicted RNA-binding protein with PIN domain